MPINHSAELVLCRPKTMKYPYPGGEVLVNRPVKHTKRGPSVCLYRAAVSESIADKSKYLWLMFFPFYDQGNPIVTRKFKSLL